MQGKLQIREHYKNKKDEMLNQSRQQWIPWIFVVRKKWFEGLIRQEIFLYLIASRTPPGRVGPVAAAVAVAVAVAVSV